LTTLAQIEQRFLDNLAAAVAARSPYVWGGKGDQIWTPQGVKPNPFGVDVFDCSGLITTSLYRADGPDLRFSHGARQLREQCPPFIDPLTHLRDRLCLRFYPGHVACHLRPWEQTDTERADPRATLIEAAGGDQNTLAPTPAGHVRRGFDLRSHYLSEGSLSGLVQQLMKL